MFSDYRNELAARAVSKAAAAGGDRFQQSGFANTILAPMIANRYPYVITPYLGLRARLSQIWINRWTILLILVLVRTLIAMTSLNDDIASARREALSACSGVESAGSALASMPHYMSQGVNELTADGVERAINGLMSMLTLTVTGVEEIVLFVINMLTSTYVCLITLVVRGSLHAAIDLIEGASHFLNSTLGEIGQGIHHTVEDFQSAYDTFINGLNDVGGIFGADGKIPKLNISDDLHKLNHLQLPSGLDSDLNTLSKNIPTFDQVHKFTNNAISLPFEEIKKLINESLPKYKFDRSLFPVPQKEQMTFCSDNNGINQFFNKLVDLVIMGRKIAIAVLTILAVLVCGPMAWLEVRRHRKLRARSALVRDSSTVPMDAVYIASRPFTAEAGIKAASVFQATRRQHLVRWAVAYATTVPALFVLSLGVAGLLSCLSRYILLKAVQEEVPDLVNEVSEFAGKVVTSLENASQSWANDTNTRILDINGRINNDVFGWVNTSTHALNHTLNVFVDESMHTLKDVFGGTILFDPVKELFNCLIGLKIEGLENALTWIHQHAHIDFPLLPNNTFSLGAASSLNSGPDSSASFLANPSTGATNGITAAVDSLAARLANSIRTEAIISACVVAVWVVIALIGIARAIYLFYGTGHMPEDVGPNHPDIDTATSPSATYSPRQRSLDGEKSPSFVGDIIHTPAAPAPAATFPPPPHTETHDFGAKHPPPPADKHPSARAAYAGSEASGNAYADAHAGNTYNGNPYTLAPRPAPRFSSVTPSPPDGKEDNALWARPLSPVPENLGYAGEREVRDATARPENVRRSEHGALGRALGAAMPAVGAKRANERVTFDGMGH